MDDIQSAMSDVNTGWEDIKTAIAEVAQKRILANQALSAMERARDEDRRARAEAEAAQNKLNALIQRKVNSVVRAAR